MADVYASLTIYAMFIHSHSLLFYQVTYPETKNEFYRPLSEKLYAKNMRNYIFFRKFVNILNLIYNI